MRSSPSALIRLILLGLVTVLVTPASALDCPHSSTGTCGSTPEGNFGSQVCATCHVGHNAMTGGAAGGGLLKPSGTVNALCESCHTSGGQGTWVFSHHATRGECQFCAYNFTTSCTDCHNAHAHEQPYDNPNDPTPTDYPNPVMRDMFLRSKVRLTYSGTTCVTSCDSGTHPKPADPSGGSCVTDETCPADCVNQEQCTVYAGIATCNCPVNYNYATGCSVCASAAGSNNNYTGAACRTTTCTQAGNPCAAGHGICGNVAGDCSAECNSGYYNDPKNLGTCTANQTCTSSPCGAYGTCDVSNGERICYCNPNLAAGCSACNTGYSGTPTCNLVNTCTGAGQQCALVGGEYRGTCQGGAASTEFQVCSEDPSGQGGKCGPTASCTNGGRSMVNEVGLSCTGRSNVQITSVQDFTTDSPSGTNIKLWLRLLWTSSHTSSYGCTLTGVSAGGSFTIPMSSVDCGLGDRSFCFVAAPVTVTLNATSHRLTCSITPPAGNTFYGGFDGIIYTADTGYTPQQGGPACDSDATFSAGTCGLNWGPNAPYGTGGYACTCSSPYTPDCKGCLSGFIPRTVGGVNKCIPDPCVLSPCSATPPTTVSCYADTSGNAVCNCSGQYYGNSCTSCNLQVPRCVCNTGYAPHATATSTDACYNCIDGYHPENGACVPNTGGVCAGQTCSNNGVCVVDRNPSGGAAVKTCVCGGRYFGTDCLSCPAGLPPTPTTEIPYTLSGIGYGTAPLAGAFADGNSTNGLGICEVCHQSTTHHNDAGTDSAHYPAANCMSCHKHKQAEAAQELQTNQNGFLPTETSYPTPSGTSCTNDTPCNGYACNTSTSVCRTSCSGTVPCAAEHTCQNNQCVKTCANCHLSGGANAGTCTSSSTVDCDQNTWAWDGTKARIDLSDYQTSGHGRLNAKANYPSGNGPARMDETTAHGCAYCHDQTVGHNAPANYFRLANFTLPGTTNGNGACLICHGSCASCTGYDPDGSSSAYAKIDSTRTVGDAHNGGKHYDTTPSTGHSGGKRCWDCHDPHGDRPSDYNAASETTTALYYMMHKNPIEHADADGVPSLTGNEVKVRPNLAGDTGILDYADFRVATNGLCRACHHDGTGSVGYTMTKTGVVATHPETQYPTACANERCASRCHTHDGGFQGEPNTCGPAGTCYTCHVADSANCASGVDVLSYVNGDGKRACISASEWTGPGHGRTSGTYLSGTIAAVMDNKGDVSDHGCNYCHNDSAPGVVHPPPTAASNFFVLVNQPYVTATFTYNGTTISRSGGSFVTDGFVAGFGVTISGTSLNNGGPYKVLSVAANSMTLTGVTLTAETVSSNLAQVNNRTCTICHEAGSPGYNPGTTGYTLINGTKKVGSAHWTGAHGGTNHEGGNHCWTCHDPHGDKGALGRDQWYMIQKQAFERPDYNGKPATDASPNMLTVAFNFDDQVDGTTGSPLRQGDYAQLCAVCHDGPDPVGHYYKNASTGQPVNADNHNITQPGACSTSCHPHADNFKPPSGCVNGGCHDVLQTCAVAADCPPSGSRRPIRDDFANGTSPAFRSHHAGNGTGMALNGTLSDADCAVCHLEAWKDTADGDKIKTNDTFHGGTGGSKKIELRRAGSTNNTGAATGFTECNPATNDTTHDPKNTTCNYWAYDKSVMSTTGRPGSWRTNTTNPNWAAQQRDRVDPFCLSCHSDTGAPAATVVGDSGATASNPFADSAITNNYDQLNRNAVVNIYSRVRGTSDLDADTRWDPPQGIYSRHAITGQQAPSRYGSVNANWNSTTYWVRTNYAWDETKSMACADCHTNDGANDASGNAHGSNSEYLLKDVNGAATEGTKAALSYVCYQCHSSGWYYTGGSGKHTGSGSDWVDTTASVGSARASSNGNWIGIACGNCHGGAGNAPTPSTAEYGTIHGTSQIFGVGLNGGSGSRSGYRFTNGNSLRYYDPMGWTGTQSACYTIAATDSWGGCTKHGGSGPTRDKAPPGQRPLSY